MAAVLKTAFAAANVGSNPTPSVESPALIAESICEGGK